MSVQTICGKKIACGAVYLIRWALTHAYKLDGERPVRIHLTHESFRTFRSELEVLLWLSNQDASGSMMFEGVQVLPGAPQDGILGATGEFRPL